MGGVAMGGVATGGVATGGVATGGVATGGVATGGVATGGVATGGVATGGVAMGDARFRRCPGRSDFDDGSVRTRVRLTGRERTAHGSSHRSRLERRLEQNFPTGRQAMPLRMLINPELTRCYHPPLAYTPAAQRRPPTSYPLRNGARPPPASRPACLAPHPPPGRPASPLVRLPAGLPRPLSASRPACLAPCPPPGPPLDAVWPIRWGGAWSRHAFPVIPGTREPGLRSRCAANGAVRSRDTAKVFITKEKSVITEKLFGIMANRVKPQVEVATIGA
jgi:hypothetical protein